MKRAARVLGLVLLSCGGQLDSGVSVGGETHFLVTCGEDCGAGLSCIEGTCTRPCEPGFSSCTELASNAECVRDPDAPQQQAFGGTCDVRCAADADCSALGRGFSCRAGACRAEPEARLTELAPVGSLRQPLVRAVDADTCLTGLRWVGGDRPSAEMHPGSDCVSCHGDDDARPLMFAGTVYAFRDDREAYYGASFSGGTQPFDDCFGIEGITVEITDSDGRVRSTVTNRAGNFYFEGRQSELAWPYSASVAYVSERGPSMPVMSSQPYYGGCARCHALPSAAPSDDLLLLSRDLDEPPGPIVPALSVLFLPGFYSP